MNKLIGSIILVSALAGAGTVVPAIAADKASARDESSQPVKDAFLKGRIVSAYAMNPHVSAFDLDVKVENGVAWLGGAVDTSIERDLAVEIARGTPDIRDVHSDISLKPGTRKATEQHRTVGRTFDDAAITASVKGKLLANTNTGGLGINVTTRRGIVTLTGVVKSDAEKDLAGRIARNSANVADVRNDLSVEAQQRS